VTYNVSDAAGNAAAPVTRTVNVIVADAIPPVIKLLGRSPVNVTQGTVYVDAGATALDNVDGNITANIVTRGLPLSTAAVRTLLVIYNVSDAAGNAAAQVTRTVNVVAAGGGGGGGVLPPPVNLPGTVRGSVVDATTNQPINGAIIKLRAGANAAPASPVIATGTTNAAGAYTINNVPAGTYTATATATGFSQAGKTVVVTPGTTTNVPVIPLSPLLAVGQVRIVLTWGATPADLDSHLIGPDPQGGRFHIYYGNTGSSIISPFAVLDVDVTTGFGPETTTISQKTNGAYSYYVYDFSNGPAALSTALSASAATVTVYQGATVAPVATYTVPAGLTGDTWHVFDMNGTTGAITPVNAVQSANATSVRLLVSPANPAVETGPVSSSTQFIARVETVNRATSLIAGATWTSSNPAVAAISTTGLSTNLAAGTTIITATDPVSGFSDTSLLTVTRIAPTVLSHTPLAAANGVLINSPVTVTFSEPMDTATISAATFAVDTVTATAVAGTISFNPAATVARFTPNGNLLPNTSYTVTLMTTGMTDVAGNAIATLAPPFNFTTGPSVITQPGVLTGLLQGGVSSLGTLEQFNMIWSGIANGVNILDRSRAVVGVPTSTFTGLAAWQDGTPAVAPATSTAATIIGTNRVIRAQHSVTGDISISAVTLDGQFGAGMGFGLTLQGADQLYEVKQRVPVHTAATLAGIYNIKEVIRTQGVTASTFATANGVITINANGTWSFSGTATDLNPITGLPNNPVAITDNGTFTVDANGTGNAASAVNQNLITRILVSADGRYITTSSMDPVTRTSTFASGIRKHTTVVSIANSTYTYFRIAPSETLAATAMRGEAGIINIDANGWITTTHGSVITNGPAAGLVSVCGMPALPDCQFMVDLANRATAGPNGTIITLDSLGRTSSAIISQNGNMFMDESPGAAIFIAIKQ